MEWGDDASETPMKLAKIVKHCRIDKPDHFGLPTTMRPKRFGLAIDNDDVKPILADGIARLAGLQERLYAQDRWACSSCCRAWMPPARTA